MLCVLNRIPAADDDFWFVSETRVLSCWKDADGEVTQRENISQFCFISLSHLITFPREREREHNSQGKSYIQAVVVTQQQQQHINSKQTSSLSL